MNSNNETEEAKITLLLNSFDRGYTIWNMLFNTLSKESIELFSDVQCEIGQLSKEAKLRIAWIADHIYKKQDSDERYTFLIPREKIKDIVRKKIDKSYCEDKESVGNLDSKLLYLNDYIARFFIKEIKNFDYESCESTLLREKWYANIVSKSDSSTPLDWAIELMIDKKNDDDKYKLGLDIISLFVKARRDLSGDLSNEVYRALSLYSQGKLTFDVVKALMDKPGDDTGELSYLRYGVNGEINPGNVIQKLLQSGNNLEKLFAHPQTNFINEMLNSDNFDVYFFMQLKEKDRLKLVDLLVANKETIKIECQDSWHNTQQLFDWFIPHANQETFSKYIEEALILLNKKPKIVNEVKFKNFKEAVELIKDALKSDKNPSMYMKVLKTDYYSSLLERSQQTFSSEDYKNLLNSLENNFPCVDPFKEIALKSKNIFHYLLFLEENAKNFLNKSQEMSTMKSIPHLHSQLEIQRKDSFQKLLNSLDL